MSDVMRREGGDEEEALLVRTGVRRIELDHQVDDGTVTVFDPDDPGIGGSTRWITSDVAFQGGVR